jgi:general secretion pathway protein L
VLTGLLILLLGAVSALHINNRIETRDHLQKALTEVQTDASAASELYNSIVALQEQANHVSTQYQDTPRFLPLWNDLSKRLDDNTWLQRLDIRDEKFSIQGVSQNASRLIEQLEQSPHLEKVRFAASVTRDRITEKERFNISAQIIKPKEGAL